MIWLLLAQENQVTHTQTLAEQWLSPNGLGQIMAIVGLLVAAWGWVQQKRKTGLSQEDSKIALKTAGSFMTAVNTLRKNQGKPGALSPDAISTLLATLQDHAEKAGVEKIVSPAVEAVKESEKDPAVETITPTEALETAVKGATRKMRKTVLETPALNPEDMEVTPVDGNPTYPTMNPNKEGTP